MNTNEIKNKLREVYPIDYADFLINFFQDKADITITNEGIIISPVTNEFIEREL